MRDLTDTAIFEAESTESVQKWTVRQRRILTTSCVGDAFYKFHLEKGKIIRQVFRKLGLFLPTDGSCDSELDIKGFAGLEIGDWHQEIGTSHDAADISEAHDNDENIEFVGSNEVIY